jgi:hypothetical protein
MSSVKRIYSSYEINNKTPGATSGSNITITTDTLYVNGNMVVGGNTVAVSQNTLQVENTMILLNAGETGPGISAPSRVSGIEVARGSLANVQLRYNETFLRWELSNDGANYSAILFSASGGAALANIYQDPAPSLSANLDLSNRTIFRSNLYYPNVSPAYGSATMSIGNVTRTGGTGLYVSNDIYANVEMINTTRSIAYSIIFG